MEGNDVVIIPNSEGKWTTPSVVAFVNDGQLNMAMKAVNFDGPVSVELFEMNGRVVRSSNENITNGAMEKSFDVNGLAPATYIIRIGNTDVQRIQKIVIQ
jgi:molecular chaperone DnaK (HSP70)